MMSSAERIYQELIREPASIWYISDQFGSKIMVKTYETSIKSVFKGCKISFLFGKDKTQNPPMFHHGFRIYDDPIHYLSVTGIQRFPEEHQSLYDIMNRNFTYIHFHNELSICVATAKLSFSVSDQLKVLNLLGKPSSLYSGELTKLAEHSMDSFDYSIKVSENETEGLYQIDTVIIDGILSNWTIIENHFISHDENNKLTLTNENEGDIFEQQARIPLESLFGKDIYRNPMIRKKDSDFRELTDVLGISNYGLFIIETKALGILSACEGRSMERKIKGLQKQIDKGINQLTGVVRKIQNNEEVFDSNGKRIQLDPNLFPHCIILVSELLNFGNWDIVMKKTLQTMIDNKMYIH